MCSQGFKCVDRRLWLRAVGGGGGGAISRSNASLVEHRHLHAFKLDTQ